MPGPFPHISLRDFYFKLPKTGTNPRGVEISNKAINKLVEHPTAKKIMIDWTRDETIQYNTDLKVNFWHLEHFVNLAA